MTLVIFLSSKKTFKYSLPNVVSSSSDSCQGRGVGMKNNSFKNFVYFTARILYTLLLGGKQYLPCVILEKVTVSACLPLSEVEA